MGDPEQEFHPARNTMESAIGKFYEIGQACGFDKSDFISDLVDVVLDSTGINLVEDYGLET
jgi:hypothetical protein